MRRLVPLLVLLAGCSSPTELMLVLKGESLNVGTDITSLLVEAQPADEPTNTHFMFSKIVDLCDTAGTSECRPQTYASDDYTGDLTLPIRFLLAPGSDSYDKEVRVWINGMKGTQIRLSDGFVFKFVRGHRLWLEVPLYGQCLDQLTCQATDQVCDQSVACTNAAPTLSMPADLTSTDLSMAGDAAVSSDLAAAHDLASHDLTVPPDLTTPPDLTQCGHAGVDCCNTAPQCDSNSVCTDAGCVACGQDGQPCCVGKTCNETGVDCFPSDTSLGSTGSCHACGAIGEMCCPNGNGIPAICDEPKAMECTSGKCVACGGSGQMCCPGSTCQKGGCITMTSTDMAGPSPIGVCE